jgi:Protein of unknown function (DUF1326)
MTDWRVQGSYLEACNCEAICPCRRVGGVAVGRSTYGVCFGILSWLIETGHAADLDLSGLATALVFWYDDDEPGSPWRFVVHVDERARDEQHEQLAAIFTGRAGGPHVLTLPWVRKPAELHDICSSAIEIVPHESVRIGTRGAIVLAAPVESDSTVSCIVPGHDRPGTEHCTSELVSNHPPFVWELTGSCAFTSSFDYASE